MESLEKSWFQDSRQNQANGGIILTLEPTNDTFQLKRINLVEGSSVKIGRMTNKGTIPTDSNGYFDSKVLSRNHAEVSYRNNQVFIKDLKSSNGTFINGKRLSAEGKESGPVELRDSDDLEFGVDIINEQDKKLLFRKVAARVYISPAGNEDVGITGIEHQKTITNGHMSTKRRGSRAQQVPNTENSLLIMLEAELEHARTESRYLSELGNMLNDTTNTRSKQVNFSDKSTDLRFYGESQIKLEEAQIQLKETEVKLNEAINSQKEYKEKFITSDKQVMELKERCKTSEKKVADLEQKCILSEKKISELEQTCTKKVIQLEQRCKESDKKAVELEDKCREYESRIQTPEDALQSTSQFDLEERLIKLTNELSNSQYFLEDTRDQLKRTEKELHASQKKCRDLQIFATKYNEAMKTIEELRTIGETFGNRIENRDETIKKFDEERITLLSRMQYLEEAAKKSNTESTTLFDQLRITESLNKNLKEEIDRERERAETLKAQLEDYELRRFSGLWHRHKKQGSEPVKVWEMTNERTTENVNHDSKKTKKIERSLFVKGSISVVIIGIGALCLSKLYS